MPPIEARLAAAGLPSLPRPAWLEIDLDVLAANARVLDALLPPGTLTGVVVKADGYGHGILAAARAAIEAGAAILLVATLDEALLIRDDGLRARILVLYPVPPDRLADAAASGVEVVAADDASVAAIAAWVSGQPEAPGRGTARAGSGALGVHLGIDTGMSRGGLPPDGAVAAARALLAAGLPALAGTWSHLATPESREVVAAQVARFEGVLAALAADGIDPGLRHLDATGGLLGGLAPTYDLVRLGLAWYGIVPPELALPRAAAVAAGVLRPALSLHARATTITPIPPGRSVGYGGTWTAARPSLVATIPVGYADGWARAYATDSWGIVRGHRTPLVGRVSSDALALDVTDVPGFGPADEVVLLGDPPAMTVHDLASRRGSIAWEVIDAFSPRLTRVYVRGDRPVGIRALDGMTRFVREEADAPPGAPPDSGSARSRPS